MEEEIYQRLKEELLEELNERIFKDSNKNNKGFIEKIAEDLFVQARNIAATKFSKNQAESLICIKIEDVIQDKINVKLGEWVQKDMKKVVEEQFKKIQIRIENLTDEFMKRNMADEMREAFDKFKDVIFERSFREKARDEILKMVSSTELETAEAIRLEGKELAQNIKKEILTELGEDLRKIKIKM